jgi:hypothetical protein
MPDLSPFSIALFVGLAALMFQLHQALRRELNEDDSLQRELVGVIDRERTRAFKVFASAQALLALALDTLQTPTSDDEWEAKAETCEANLYEMASNVYFPLASCVEVRATRKEHVAWLRRGKSATLASVITGVVGTIICYLAVTTKWPWATLAAYLCFAVLVVEMGYALTCWYKVDGRQSVLAEVRRRRGRNL